MTRRRLVAAGLATLVVAGLLWADAVTLQRAKPSFQEERRNFANLVQHDARASRDTTTTTTTAPTRSAPSRATTTG